uniref:ZP domain-containing protein n=1 Tax=Panagrellus redivivus TaxID=6233 RepID=A0A7E4UNH2_PANRE
MWIWIAFVLFALKGIDAIPVDNGVEGEPEIECGGSTITVNFNTRTPFDGHVYVKGLFNEPGCRNDENGRTVAGITLPFDTCNVARTRSLNPRGVFVTTTVVITFHPHFVTKVDRAYRVQCFYMEADKTVSAEIAVSDLTTAFQSQLVPMPICRYEILDGGPTGEAISFAQVGDQVYHKWTCDSETVDTFCMVVHSCTVDDGNGDTVTIINDDGCAIDRFVLNNLEYPTDLMAGQEAHVYKYADRSQLFYQCQITITIKDPGEDCSRPQCEEPTGTIAAAAGAGAPPPSGLPPATGAAAGAGAAPPTRRPNANPPSSSRPPPRLRLFRRFRRAARDTEQWRENSAGTMDVRTELNALDLLDEGGFTSTLLSRPDIAARRHRVDTQIDVDSVNSGNTDTQIRTPMHRPAASGTAPLTVDAVLCFDKTYFNAMTSLAVIVLLGSSTAAIFFMLRAKKHIH